MSKEEYQAEDWQAIPEAAQATPEAEQTTGVRPGESTEEQRRWYHCFNDLEGPKNQGPLVLGPYRYGFSPDKGRLNHGKATEEEKDYLAKFE